MENIRYLLAAVAALTLTMSVISGVNPSYFAGLNALADDNDQDEDNNSGPSNDDHDEDDEEDNDNSARGSHDDEDEQEDDDNKGKEKHEDDGEKIVKPIGNNSKVALEIDDDVELQVEIEDGDLNNGTYDVVFSCESPDVDEEFTDALNVTNGKGQFEEDLSLTNGTYAGCEVEVGGLSAIFPSFAIKANEDDDEEDDDDDNRGSSRGSNDDEDDNSGRGSHNEGSTDDKRNDRKHRIVNSTSGIEVHERHRNANPSSPGDYKPGWNYTLEAEGEATHAVHDENVMHEANATIDVDMSVWKSNKAIILLDVVGGTIELENQDYEVRIGYAIYSIHHDAMKLVALTTDDDGNVFRLKLRASAVDETDQFPMESGSIDLVFGGDVNNRFEDWNLLLEGSIEAN